jgi:hypothetical protein
MLNVGALLGGGFALLRRRPLDVFVWGLIYAAGLIGLMYEMRPFLEMRAQGPVPLGEPGAAADNFVILLVQIWLIELPLFVVFTVLATAAQRAVLRAAGPGFASLHFGRDEVRMLALALLLVVGPCLGWVVLGLVVAMLIGWLAPAVGTGVGAVFTVAGTFGLFALFVWFEVRLCLAFPLTLLRRRIIIGEAWRLTRGRFWTLLCAFLVLFLALLALWTAIGALTQAAYWGELIRGGMDPQTEAAEAAGHAAAQLAFSPLMVVGLVLAGLVGGATVAMFGGALATAVRLLVDDADPLAETFA